MKLNHLWLTALLTCQLASFAQSPIYLRRGTLNPSPNITIENMAGINAQIQQGSALFIVQFASLPNEETRKRCSAAGWELLDYLPERSYTVAVTRPATTDWLKQAGITTVIPLPADAKLDDYLFSGTMPAWAGQLNGTIHVWISYPKILQVGEVINQLKEQGFIVLSQQFQHYRVLSLRIAANRVRDLAALPCIEWMQLAPPADQPLNFTTRYASRANVLNAPIASGGKDLNGQGITVGVGDNADIQTHIDFTGRLINRAPLTASGHGTHVSGTVAGAGIINELYRGYAPKANLVSQSFSGILWNAPSYVQDHGMVVTNNSYGDIIACDYHGTYDLISRMMDQMAFDLPSLQNVFAAGNSGASVCFPFTSGYRTVLGGYQCAKNVISVGATNDSGLIASFSSRGPVKDGRIKPEIMAVGQGTISPWPFNIYSPNNGTSMAAPGVAGGLALLYQRYRQLNGGANPRNALMKALLCNGASDRGNAGPDYQYGFGWMNLLRSIDMLENSRYSSGTLSQGGQQNIAVPIPAGTSQFKVLLYWNDPAASLISSKTLVNDLDLQVTDPAGNTVLPLRLDTTAASVGNPATTGVDRLNNLEQVVINNPAAGNYTIRVNASTIAQGGSQEYFLVYDPVPVQLKLTYPAGAEKLVPGEMTKINWDASGLTGTATLDYSIDNGANWITIANGIDINRQTYTWWVPATPTHQAMVRITRESGGATSASSAFVILGQPAVSFSSVQCQGYITINWNTIPGATDYEVMRLQGDDMISVANLTGNSYTFSGLSKDSVYWVAVRARINGKPGRRSAAVTRQPNAGSCAGSISDNDLAIENILAPQSGRIATSTQLSASTVITATIRNLDDVSSSGYTVSYSVNGGSWTSEAVTTAIGPGNSTNYNFITPYNFSSPGTYVLRVAIKHNNTDPVSANDTLTTVIRQLANPVMNLSSPLNEGFETEGINTYRNNTLGFSNLQAFDFTSTTSTGRARTFLNTGIAQTGSRAITLDADQYTASGNISYLTDTYNFSNYSVTNTDIRLDFNYMQHGNVANAANRVWVRGNDTQAWVEIYDLFANQADAGVYRKTPSLEISRALALAGQEFSSSFQIRFGQYGQLAATDKENGAGYTFDNLRMYIALNDLQLQSLNNPSSASCALGTSTAIQITVRNTTATAKVNVPVKYRINNGSWITEQIPSLPGNSIINYSFATTADLSALGAYTITAVVDAANDSYRENDTISVTIRNLPLITSFPYLQNFELNDGGWYTGGKKSSWEAGTPASSKINRAASGMRAWKTRLLGGYNDNELSYLYSPCFDISGMTKPTLSFSVALDIEDCGTSLCDGAWVEYSADGITWQKLGSAGTGTNWYNKSTDQLWSVQNYANWHVATTALPVGLNKLRLRFVLASDPGVSREGIAIDDIHVYDNVKGIYTGPGNSVSVAQNLTSSNNFTQFEQGGQLIASVKNGNEIPGNTVARAYLFNGTVRSTNQQYYLHRNLTIKPANRDLTDSVTVRLYLLDSEVDSLLKASSCLNCSKPASAYDLGISLYSDQDTTFENGSINDNQQGLWSFIPATGLTMVPFDKGYYAEFRTKQFGEFWWNGGGLDKSTPLPVKLMDFTASKMPNGDARLQWKVAAENNVARYELQLAMGATAMQAGIFTPIGSVTSLGNTSLSRIYTFDDQQPDKTGKRYYRVRTVNIDSSSVLSTIRMLQYDEAMLWQVYPNPSQGIFYLYYQLNNGEKLNYQLTDITGRVLQVQQLTGTGNPQKIRITLGKNYPSGLYMLQLNGAVQQIFKLEKL